MWTYCEDFPRFIFGDALGDPTADEILQGLNAEGNGRTRTDIRGHFQRRWRVAR